MSNKASASLHVDQRYSTLELIGGREACFAAQQPDLLVHGGALFKKTVCFKGLTVLQDTTVEGNLTVLGNTYLGDLYTGNIIGDIDIIGNLLVNGQPVGGVCITSADLTSQVCAAPGGTIVVFGNIVSVDDIAAGTLHIANDAVISGDLTVTGNLHASFLNIQGNCLLNDSGTAKVCVNQDNTITMTTNDTRFVSLGPNGEWQQGSLVSATAINAHAEGLGVTDIVAALSTYSKTDVDGRTGAVFTTASGVAAHAEGSATVASGVGSHAEGGATQAIGDFSHAEGLGGKATGIASHVEGDPCLAEGDFSHAEGQDTHTTSGGVAAHAEGRNTLASASAAHAEGLSSQASGEASHAEGNNTHAVGLGAHSEGLSISPGGLEASGIGSHVEGYTESSAIPALHAVNSGSHVEGFATGTGTIVSNGFGSHAEGHADISILAQGNGAHAEGWNTHATADAAHAEGKASHASGVASHAGGLNSLAINHGQRAHGAVQFSSLGDAQSNRHVVKAELSSMAASADLEDTTNGYVISVPTGTSWAATVRLTGVDLTTNDTYCLVQNLRLKNVANVLTVSPMASDQIGEGTLTAGFVTVAYGSSGNDGGVPRFTITVAVSPAANTTRWVACVDSTQAGSL